MKKVNSFLAILFVFTMTIANARDSKDTITPPHNNSLSKLTAVSSEQLIDNGDGTFTFIQQIDENSTPPHYDASASVGGFEIYSWYNEDYGWMHTFSQWNSSGLNILLAKLTIVAWDIDSEPHHGYDGEYDGVHIDGTLLSPGYLQGETATWSTTEFDLPINAIIDDGNINVWLDIDMHHNEDTWATTLDYSLMEITYSLNGSGMPYQPELAILPSELCAGTDDDLQVQVIGPNPADPDGEDVTYRYRWFVDVGTGGFIDDEFAGRGDHTGCIVPAEDTRVGDIWRVHVTPVDENNVIGIYSVATFPQIIEGSCFVSLFDSDKNVGLAPVVSNFCPLVELSSYLWHLDTDITLNWDKPCYAFWEADGMDGKPYEIQLNDFMITEFIDVYPAGGLGHLKVVAASPGLKEFNWENAVDGDIFWYNGTALVTHDDLGVWAIFEFVDEGTRSINKIRMMTDTGIGQQDLQVNQFEVLVSTTDTDAANFTSVLSGHKTNNTDTPLELHDDWVEWDVASTEAKYIKLVVHDPSHLKWRQIGEFEVWCDVTLADAAQSTIQVDGNLEPELEELVDIKLTVKDDDGNAITGLTQHDIHFFSQQLYGMPCYHNECTQADSFGAILEIGDGMYSTSFKSSLAGQKKVLASVNGVIIDTGAELNVAPDYGDGDPDCDSGNELVFVTGTECYTKGFDLRGWDNLVDDDYDDWDGTTLTRGTGDPLSPAWAIFRFCDDNIYKFNHIYVVTDNGTDDDTEPTWQAVDMEVWVSTTTMDMDAFTCALKMHRTDDPMGKWFKSSDYIHAKYILVKLVSPNYYPGGWRQIVEMDFTTEDKNGPVLSELSAASNAAQVGRNYPNPLNPTTAIQYNVYTTTHVSLRVYDVTGRLVTTLVDEQRAPGSYTVSWNGTQHASGIYFYRFEADNVSQVHRMILMK